MSDWLKIRYLFYVLGGFFSILGFLLCFVFFNSHAGLLLLCSALFLYFGFFITELLVAVSTGVRTASASAKMLLGFSKLAWWLAIFWCSTLVRGGDGPFVAAGGAVFLISLLLSALKHFGWPKISPPSM